MSDIRECFDLLDLTGRGFVSVTELAKVLACDEFRDANPEPVGKTVLQTMFRMADVDGAGQIDSQEFSAMVQSQINGWNPDKPKNIDAFREAHLTGSSESSTRSSSYTNSSESA
eukprot:151981_1